MIKLYIKNSFSAPVYHMESISSTMVIARNFAKENKPHGTVICTDYQEAGRGRQGRAWHTERGKNLMFTLFLKFNEGQFPKALSLRTGLALALSLENLFPELYGRIKIKWPNDLMLISTDMAYKIAGILIESDGNNVYIGIGVNIFQLEFPEALKSKAGSLIHFLDNLHDNTRLNILEHFLSFMHREIGVVKDEWQQPIHSKLYMIGENVKFAEGGPLSEQIIEGKLSGMGSEGELLITPNGEKEEKAFHTGELRIYS